MIKCVEIGQYLNHLKAIFADNCRFINPKDLRMMIELIDAIRRCGTSGGGSGELPEDAVLYTSQQREEFEKEIARINIGATSTIEVINIINDYVPDLVELLGYEVLVNKQNDLTPDGTGKKYPTVDAVNEALANFNGDKHYEHDQAIPSAVWVINHNMGKVPSVTVTDSAGTVVEGQITMQNTMVIVLEFNAIFSGKAYCN